MAVYGKEALAIANEYTLNRDYSSIPMITESEAVLEFLMKPAIEAVVNSSR